MATYCESFDAVVKPKNSPRAISTVFVDAAKSKFSSNRKRSGEKKPSESWSEFSDETTIHGLRYIWGTKAPSTYCRLIWGSVWLTMFAMFVMFCIDSTMVYFQFDVSTSRNFAIRTLIDFPAVTICNRNLYRRSVVGRSYEFMKVLATFQSLTEDDDEIERLAKENWEYCRTNKTSNMTELLDKGDVYWKENGFLQTMQHMATDYARNVVGVWYNQAGRQEDFRRQVLHHVVGRGVCTTFNIGDTYVNSFVKKGRWEPSTGYVDTDKGYQHERLNLTSANIHTGLRMVLDTNQHDYCGVLPQYGGSGFKVIVHEPNDYPFFAIQSALHFGPGADYNVMIKPLNIKRKTAHLQRCFTNFNLTRLPPAMKSVYFKNQCYYQCFVEEVSKQCNCVPPSIYNGNNCNSKTNDKCFGEEFCWNRSMICMNRVEFTFVHSNMNERCPSCKMPCEETLYEFQISKMLFPSDNLLNWVKDVLWDRADYKKWGYGDEDLMSYNDTKELMLNILVVNFHFDSMYIETVTEEQAFTLLDLFAYYGNISGLFLGMSVLSVAEVIDYLSCRLETFYRRKRSKNRVN